MSGVFKSFKDLFVESDPKANQSGDNNISESTAKPETSTVEAKSSKLKGPSLHESTGGKVNEKFLGVLFQALEDNNLDGFDYLEYKKSLQYLKKMDMDDRTRYQSAFASARTMGVTPNQLMQTAGSYLNVLSDEDNKFQQAWKSQSEKQIVEKQKEKKQLQQDINEKTQLIAKLENEIENSTKRLESIDGLLEQATKKVTKTKNDFDTSYVYLVEQIKDDMSKMKLYLE